VIVIPKGTKTDAGTVDTELREIIDNGGTDAAPINPEDYQMPPQE
jgi:hypothetical protein